VLDGAEGVEHLGFGDGHRLLSHALGGHTARRSATAEPRGWDPGISTTTVGRIPAVCRPPLPPSPFAAVVTAIPSAFGDPTRRAIYLYVHEHDDGVTASAVAERFDLHPNVARHHLDKLVAGGYVAVAAARPSGGTPGGGAPATRPP